MNARGFPLPLLAFVEHEGTPSEKEDRDENTCDDDTDERGMAET